jgi:hypothetical protein
MNLPFFLIRLAFVVTFAFLSGCATVPKEVVELSYTMGQDLSAVHSSYRKLVCTHFAGLRAQTNSFLENRWIPTFLEDFIQRGGLVQSAKGADAKLVLEEVHDWAEVALETIEEKKKELINPINSDEEALLRLLPGAIYRLHVELRKPWNFRHFCIFTCNLFSAPRNMWTSS